jgi:hypothetical protein
MKTNCISNCANKEEKEQIYATTYKCTNKLYGCISIAHGYFRFLIVMVYYMLNKMLTHKKKLVCPITIH